jgi:hypothetical protein
MATRVKEAHVHFYAIEPVPAFDRQQSFTSGHYPRKQVFETIRARDPAEESYRIADNLLGGETLCVLHEDGPEPILGAYFRDNLAKPLTEYKGQIAEAMLRDGEAPVNAAYLAYFPNDVVGLLRTSSASPNFAKIGLWLTIIGGYACGLLSLTDADTMAQLRDHASGIRRLNVRCRRSALGIVDNHSPSVAEALRRVGDLNPESDQMGIEIWAGKNGQDRFSQLALQELSDLIWATPVLEEALVKVAGRKQPINLKRARVSGRTPVVLQDKKQVGLREAAEALFAAYEQEQASVRKAVATLRGLSDDPSAS